MPLTMVNVKEEVDWEIGVRVECEEYVKEEPAPAGCGGGGGVSAAAARAGLYAGHDVDGDLVLGPTALQPPDAAFPPTGGRREARPELPRLRACSVALERLPADLCGRAHAQRDCRDSKQYDKRTNTQDSAAGEYSDDTCEEPFPLRACYVAVERLPPDRRARNTRTDTRDLAAEEYCCDACGKWFKIKNTLIRHLLQHRADSNPSGTMSRAPLSPQSQTVHRQTIHGSEISLMQSTVDRHPLIDTGEKPYKCEVCKKQYSRRDTLVRHKEIHKEQKSYKCQKCAKQFTQRMCLNRHQLIHTGEKPHKCEVCSKRFRYQSSLLVHLQFHIGKLFKCKLCKKQYANKYHLVAHERVHSGERPFKCDTCGNRYSRRDHLVRHRASHAGDKPYTCDTCNKNFTREDHLDRHKLVHTGEKPYKCEICMKKFTQQVNLVAHLRVHYKKFVKQK